MKLRHLLSITDLSDQEILKILKSALKIKKELKKKKRNKDVLRNRTLAMIFEKPSLRTRVSFEAGMTQFGGHAIYLASSDIGLGVRESIADVAGTLSGMVDIFMARTFKHETVAELAKYSKVPVINGLSDLEHPCQILADLLTILEVKKKLKKIKIVFIGDGNNNVTHSLALASGILGINFVVVAPRGYQMKKEVADMARVLAKKSKGSITEADKIDKTIQEADVIYTDTWVSMGAEGEKAKRLKIFKPYQVTNRIMKMAKKNAVFMHDMPAYRGNEVVAEVIDGPQSVNLQQAENRLHAQKALVLFLLGVKY